MFASLCHCVPVHVFKRRIKQVHLDILQRLLPHLNIIFLRCSYAIAHSCDLFSFPGVLLICPSLCWTFGLLLGFCLSTVHLSTFCMRLLVHMCNFLEDTYVKSGIASFWRMHNYSFCRY